MDEAPATSQPAWLFLRFFLSFSLWLPNHQAGLSPYVIGIDIFVYRNVSLREGKKKNLFFLSLLCQPPPRSAFSIVSRRAFFRCTRTVSMMEKDRRQEKSLLDFPSGTFLSTDVGLSFLPSASRFSLQPGQASFHPSPCLLPRTASNTHREVSRAFCSSVL